MSPLVAAWLAWDDAPASETLARRLEDQIRAATAPTHLTGSMLRDAVGVLRRSGRTIPQAIAILLGDAHGHP